MTTENSPEPTTIHVDDTLDARGLFCPEPVMMLHSAFRDLDSGQVLKLLATDPSTTRDVPKFCHFLGHELLQQQQTDGEFHYWLQKK
ncbi:sulfurtransferase TusA [Pseudohongiella nitratireducens]|uniref:Sulfurtransferase TusA n=1 Tax=Pseudohongiella nitratireducens TaxID=1768907 RepID=A0A916QKJ8_9GAMM|nr:sulfurtransferase TusA [Pseudohongiella nitratireducens]MDF1622760.1 sulfurtransferase TusA [Pseudohongiella nitratireducens]GFZ76653.1 sulfurtransferase TusA [Pseudohongiella nitratireducens]|tara:strand:+ start:2411 stop:2671 length:261 start_codon:yes stop_codon:yes gene_type:complete